MQKKELECLVNYSGRVININSGLPEDEPLLDEGTGTHRARVELRQNGSATIRLYDTSAIVPPLMDDVLKDGNLSVKRTSRHFIVKMKFPIIEGTDATVDAHKDMWTKSRKAIVAAREEIKKTF